jgi:hypothetical protein
MRRLTRHIDEFPCRVADGCKMEDYLEEHNIDIEEDGDICKGCPFLSVFDRMGQYEDFLEKDGLVIFKDSE